MRDLSNWIDKHAAFDPDKAAILFQGETWSYARFAAAIRCRARWLKHEMGVARGDRIAFLGFNSPENLILMFAGARLGALFIPLNWRLAAPEHQYILEDATAKLCICEGAFKAHAETLMEALPDCDFLADGFDPGEESPWRIMDCKNTDPTKDDRNPNVSLDAPLLLMYTSGTTGHPKGAVLTQNAVQWNAFNSLHMHAMSSADRVLNILPLFHVGGLNIQTTPILYVGGTLVLHDKFHPVACLEAIERDRPTLLVLIPATIDAVISLPQWEQADLSSLRLLSTGSSHVPRRMLDAFLQRNIPVIQIYGSTETCPVAVYQRERDAYAKVGSVGKPGLHSEVRIVDEAGRDVEEGVSGELLVRGPNVMYEYWGNAEATSEALRDGWFYTGDVGYRDADGFLWINDRKRDLVISGGENIYPAELEAVLVEIPEIREAAVVGRPHPKWVEVPVAVVVLQPGKSLTKEAVLTHFEGRLARFKHPKDVIFKEALPRNVMGKVQKFELRWMVQQEE